MLNFRNTLILVAAALLTACGGGAPNAPPGTVGNNAPNKEKPSGDATAEQVAEEVREGLDCPADIDTPARADKAPVLIISRKDQPMTDWLRAIADQAAGEGYIALVPDPLPGVSEDARMAAHKLRGPVSKCVGPRADRLVFHEPAQVVGEFDD